MAPTYQNPKNDRRSLTHRGSELGSSHVTLSQNATGREDSIIEWECPRKYDLITYAAGRHNSKFVPRGMETQSGDGSATTFSLTANIAPPSGETTIDDMPYDPVVAYDTDAGAEIAVDSYDFNANSVTLASAPNNATDNVKLYYVMTEGTLKFIGHDQFGHRIAALDEWGIPLRVFNDFDQAKNMTKVHMTGAISWEEAESLVLYLDGPRQIVWEDADYPRGSYVSSIEQRVDVDV